MEGIWVSEGTCVAELPVCPEPLPHLLGDREINFYFI